MGPIRRYAPVLVSAIAFGVVVAVLKGQDPGARDALGNMSAPWMLLPFLAGMRARGVGSGAVAGAVSTLVALVAFYVTESFVLDLGPHPWLVDLRLTLGSGHVYEELGALSGPVFGALGGAWTRHRTPIAPIALGCAFVGEPLLVWVLARTQVWGPGELFRYPALWVGEVFIGVVTIAGAVLVARRAPAGRGPQRAGPPLQ